MSEGLKKKGLLNKTKRRRKKHPLRPLFITLRSEILMEIRSNTYE